jgi:hypothetical protein
VTRAEVNTDRGLVTTTSTDARAIWTHSFSASLQARIGLGVLDVTTEALVSTRSSAPALDFSITQAWPRWQLTVGGGRQLQPDGLGSLLQQDRVQVHASRRISERLSVGLEAARSRDAYFLSFYDRDYLQDAVTVQWRFKRRWVLDGSVTDRGQQWVTLGLPKQTGLVSQFSISYRGG